MNAEDRLSELMDAATRALDPPLEAMLEEGVCRGRIRRRRRRVAVAGGTMAAVLLSAGAVALAARGHDGPRLDVGGPGTVSGVPTVTAPRPSGTASRAVGAVPGATEASPVPLNSIAAATILRRLVGTSLTLVSVEQAGAAEKAIGIAGIGTTASGLVSTSTAAMIVRDGEGLAQVFVSVGKAKTGAVDPLDCATQAALLKTGGARPSGALAPSCTVSILSDGAEAMQEVLGANANGVYQTRVVVNRTDGVIVGITVVNGILSPPAAKLTRAVPPLSLGMWTVVALNPLWQPEVSPALAKGE